MEEQQKLITDDGQEDDEIADQGQRDFQVPGGRVLPGRQGDHFYGAAPPSYQQQQGPGSIQGHAAAFGSYQQPHASAPQVIPKCNINPISNGGRGDVYRKL